MTPNEPKKEPASISLLSLSNLFMSSTPKLLFVVLFIVSCAGPGKLTTDNDQTINNLKKHIYYLADDKLEGRRTGTNGEELARDYITKQFLEVGLQPKGTEYFNQDFIVDDGKQMNAETSFRINGNELQKGNDYFVFPFSPYKKIEAGPSIALQEVGMPWFYDLKDVLEENQNNPHFDLNEYISKTYLKSNERGATVVILYNTSSIDDNLKYDAKDKTPESKIPFIYVTKDAAKKYLADKSTTLNIELVTSVGEKNMLGHNVIGYIDNKAPTTVILGAHYDHLGYGEDGNSRYTGKEPAIHNGADDNASGTAALIELARMLKTSKAKNHNYLFIAFSGEELGLFGSKYFTEHPSVDLSSVDYMINMDMVGRLNDSSKALTIGGYGTSPSWSTVINKDYFGSSNATKKTSPLLEIRVDSSGTGPSDHTSFYRKDIPVLFYFTGLHADYHKPSDDADKINYSGEYTVLHHVLYVIESLDKQPKLIFTKTRETQTTTSARFSVSLGIMPDYTFSGTGVRADGISEGRPAQKAGLKTGDVIIQLGDYHVTSLENYMQALGKFKKGEKTKVKFKRGDETLEAEVEF